MEIEYKWEMPDGERCAGLLKMLLQDGALSEVHSIHMHACYYDTVDRYVYSIHGGLRRRMENETSVCCLKLAVRGDDGFRTRKEFEVEADDIHEGLMRLKASDAPADICEELLSRELELLCETDFMRDEYDFASSHFSAKLAFDRGKMTRQDRQAPISELEFELVEGDEEAFHQYASKLEHACDLVVQPKSKLARAASL